MEKYSRQRELIFNAVKENMIHMTAEDVYNMLKKDNPKLSLGTVYRNLNRLAESGSIRRLTGEGPDRYDADLSQHYHMVCENCGTVIDVHTEYLREVDQAIERLTGLPVYGHNIWFKTVCARCKGN